MRWSEKDLFLVGHNWRGEERPLEYLNESSSMQKNGEKITSSVKNILKFKCQCQSALVFNVSGNV